MANDPIYKIWVARLFFTLCVFVLILIPLAPIDLTPSPWPRPNLLFCTIFVVILRRPELAPYWLVAIIFLMFDVLRILPIGLWSAVALVGIEITRNNRRNILESLFIGEWLGLFITFTACSIAVIVIQAVFILPSLGIRNTLYSIAFTTLSYPFVLFVVTRIFRVRRPAPQDFDKGIQSL